MNPEDLGTRGMTAKELTDSTKWWNGPDLLCSPEAECLTNMCVKRYVNVN